MFAIAKVVLTGWAGMFAVIMATRMAVGAIRTPPVPDSFRIPFEFVHMILAGLAGGWVCAAKGGQDETVCVLVLALLCSTLELVSLRVGWTTFDFAHALAGIVAAPVTLILSVVTQLFSS